MPVALTSARTASGPLTTVGELHAPSPSVSTTAVTTGEPNDARRRVLCVVIITLQSRSSWGAGSGAGSGAGGWTLSPSLSPHLLTGAPARGTRRCGVPLAAEQLAYQDR